MSDTTETPVATKSSKIQKIAKTVATNYALKVALGVAVAVTVHVVSKTINDRYDAFVTPDTEAPTQ